MKKAILILLMLFCIAHASQPPVPDTPTAIMPSQAISQQINVVMGILVVMMILLIVIAAAVYAIGQMFGAETRARASVWAKSMIVAVGVSAILVMLLFFIQRQAAAAAADPYQAETFLKGIIDDMKVMAQNALGALIILLVIISALAYALGQMAGAETRARASVWATGILAGALLAAVLYVILFQILTQFQITFFAGTILEPFQTIIISVAFFVTVIILVTYLISRVFQVPEWEAYLNIELSNLTGSFLIVLFVLGLFGVGTLFSVMVVGKDKPVTAAITFLQNTVANNLLTGLYDIFRIQTCASMLSVFSRRIGEAVLTNVFKVFPGMDVFVSITNVVGYGLVAVYGSMSAQITLLNLIDATMQPFFLPAGLVLRFFPPTRDAGSFLIAVAFAFQFVFPLMYLINAEVLEYLEVKPYDKHRSEAIIQAICGPVKFGAFGILFSAVAPIQQAAGLAQIFKTMFSEPLLSVISMSEFVAIMESLAVLSLFGLFIPAFALVVTIAFINAMTKFLTTKV